LKSEIFITKNRAIIVLIFCALIYGIHYIYFHGGYFGIDDIEYCRLANSITSGSFDHNSSYAHRYASFVPLAGLYFLFGVNDFSNFLMGIIVCSVIVIVTLKSLKSVNNYGYIAGAMFLIFAPMHIMYVEKPMPDILVELGFIISFISYFSMRFELNIINREAIWFVAGVVLMVLAKETFLVFYPFFIGLMGYDFFKKRFLYFWKSVVILILVFLALYFGGAYFFLGNAFQRIHHLFEGQYVSPCSYDLLPLSATLQRIGSQLWLDLIRNLFFIPICFLPLIFMGKDEKHKFVSISFIALLLLANFMTISYIAYVPLCPDPRHSMYVLPLGAMVMAYGIGNINKLSLPTLFYTILILFFLLGISVMKTHEFTWWLYLPIVIGIVVGYKEKKKLMAVFLSIGFLSVFVMTCIYNKKVNYLDQRLLNDYTIHKIDGFKYVITDRINFEYGQFHCKFDTSSVKFIHFKSLDSFVFKPGIPQYLVSNGMTSYFSNTQWESLPEEIRTAQDKLPKVYENKSGAVYRLK
jgi:hypothetical protein